MSRPWVAVEVCAEIALASPKSATLTWPRWLISTFSGLMSRCTRPASCAQTKALSTGSMSLQRPQRRHRCLVVDDVAQGVALDVLHHDVRAAGVGALVEHRHHVRVGQPGGRPRLPVELAGELGVVAQPDVHHLERDGPGQPGVDGGVDGGHAAAGQPGRDVVATVDQVTHEGVADYGRTHLAVTFAPNTVGKLVVLVSGCWLPASLDVRSPYGAPDGRAARPQRTRVGPSRSVRHSSRMPQRSDGPESDRRDARADRPRPRVASPPPSAPDARPGSPPRRAARASQPSSIA